MREIKFRAWNLKDRCWMWANGAMGEHYHSGNQFGGWELNVRPNVVLMQFTGLHDKNGMKEVYEGDIIDEYGNIKGNIYEMDKGEADLVIEGFGTSAWSKTEKAGLERGLKYAE